MAGALAGAVAVFGPFVCTSQQVVECVEKFNTSKVLKPLVDKAASLYPYISVGASKTHPVAFWDADNTTILLNPDADAAKTLLALLLEVLNALNNSVYAAIREEVVPKKISKDLFVWYMERKEHTVSLDSVRLCDALIAAKELPANTKKRVFYTDPVKHYALQWLFGHSEHWCAIYDGLTGTKKVAKGPWPKPIDDFQKQRLISLVQFDTKGNGTKEMIDRWKTKFDDNLAYKSLVENAEWFLSANRTITFSQRIVAASGG